MVALSYQTPTVATTSRVGVEDASTTRIRPFFHDSESKSALTTQHKRQEIELANIDRRRNRKGAPKTKTGCQTCRTRRIKCDELKPICEKCIKANTTCAYSRPKVDISTWKNSSHLRPLAPIATYKSSCDHLQILQEVRPGTAFSNDTEYRYFRHFCDNLAKSLSGPFKTELWERYIPQTGEKECFVRNAIIAIGALSLEQAEDAKDDDHRDQQLIVKRHETYAMTKYVKVLEDMRVALATEIDDPRRALIACLLVFCFESLRGNQYSAALHASGGLSLIDRLGSSSSFEEKRVANSEWKRRNNTTSLDDDLYSAYAGLDMQALFLIDIRSPAVHLKYKQRMTKVINDMPDSFDNIQEALEFWRLLLRRNFHFIAIARAATQAYAASDDSTPWLSQKEDIETYLGPENNAWSISSNGLRLPAAHPLRAEQERYLEHIDRFHNAARIILERHSTSKSEDDQDFYKASVIRIQMEANKISLAYCFFPPAIHWDNYLSSYQIILSLIPPLLPYLKTNQHASSPSSRLAYKIDIGILAALTATVNLCRFKAERDAGLDLFKAIGSYREGVWDAQLAYALSGWMASLEEPWRDENGHIPEERRVEFEDADIDIGRRWVLAKGWQGDGTGLRKVRREEVLTW